MTPKSSGSLSSINSSSHHHHFASSKMLSMEVTPSDRGKERMGGVTLTIISMEESVPVMGAWENAVLRGKLHNIQKVPQDLLVKFQFRVALHCGS